MDDAQGEGQISGNQTMDKGIVLNMKWDWHTTGREMVVALTVGGLQLPYGSWNRLASSCFGLGIGFAISSISIDLSINGSCLWSAPIFNLERQYLPGLKADWEFQECPAFGANQVGYLKIGVDYWMTCSLNLKNLVWSNLQKNCQSKYLQIV